MTIKEQIEEIKRDLVIRAIISKSSLDALKRRVADAEDMDDLTSCIPYIIGLEKQKEARLQLQRVLKELEIWQEAH
jgi:hypothetical protein